MKKTPKIIYIIERFFILSILLISLSTTIIGIYFHNYYEQEKIKESSQKIHNILAQLIVPSLLISNVSEVQRLLHMASSANEVFVIDNDKSIIMSDYENREFYNFVKKFNTKNCKNYNRTQKIGSINYRISCSFLKDNRIQSKNKIVGELFSFKTKTSFNISTTIIYQIGILLVLFVILFVLLRKILYKQLLKPILFLKNHLSKDSSIASNLPEKECKLPLELYEIKVVFDKLLLTLQDEYIKRIEAEKTKALVDLVASVCHDIKSPLAALELSLAETKDLLPDSDKEIQIEAIQSIRDIANNLLERYRRNGVSGDYLLDQESNMPLLLTSMLETVISQKRLEWQEQPVELNYIVKTATRGFWVTANPYKIKRVLSNILNNAYESFKNKRGKIDLILEKTNDYLSISICDNGRGIAEEYHRSVVNGFSLKHSGKGLGLSSAKNFMEKLGGSLVLSSREYEGTQVKLNFPFIKNPDWFTHKITINRNATVIIVDDDESIHAFWKKKLHQCSLNVEHFLSGHEFLHWFERNKADNEIFIIDYELRDENLNGLKLLKNINPERRGYLVTSYAEDKFFHKQVEDLNLWLYPKNLLNELEVRII